MPPNVGGKKGQTSPNVPSYIKQQAKFLTGEARGLYDNPQYNTLPGMDPATLDALSQRENMARAGTGFGDAAGGEVLKTLQGMYLSPDSNPHLREFADRAANEARSRATGAMAGSGRVGSGAYAGAIADAEFGTRNAIYAQNYDAERGRMQNALQLAPSAYGLTMADSGTLEDVGRARESETMRQYDWPYAKLDRFTNTIYGNPSFSTPGTQTRKGNFDWLSMLGGMANPMGSMGGGGGGGGGGGMMGMLGGMMG